MLSLMAINTRTVPVLKLVLALCFFSALALPAMAACSQMHPSAPTGSTFDRPVPDDFRLAALFGQQMHPILRTMRLHDGIDFAGPNGAPIKSVAAGEVMSAGRNGELGNQIELRHRAGLDTGYAQLSHFADGISPGRCVERGDVIGYIGTTGLSTGPHLHFTVRVDGIAVDPIPFVAGLATEPKRPPAIP
jgi:murein DD-endopeptidase MepM/ murein hydrolase activator NlpD